MSYSSDGASSLANSLKALATTNPTEIALPSKSWQEKLFEKTLGFQICDAVCFGISLAVA